MPDRVCHVCYLCNNRFTVVKRKHHCRLCGQVFCSNCCSNHVNGEPFGFTTTIRICNLCLSLMEETPSSNDIILANRLTESGTVSSLFENSPLPTIFSSGSDPTSRKVSPNTTPVKNENEISNNNSTTTTRRLKSGSVSSYDYFEENSREENNNNNNNNNNDEDDEDEYDRYNDDTPEFIQNNIQQRYGDCIYIYI